MLMDFASSKATTKFYSKLCCSNPRSTTFVSKNQWSILSKSMQKSRVLFFLNSHLYYRWAKIYGTYVWKILNADFHWSRRYVLPSRHSPEFEIFTLYVMFNATNWNFPVKEIEKFDKKFLANVLYAGSFRSDDFCVAGHEIIEGKLVGPQQRLRSKRWRGMRYRRTKVLIISPDFAAATAGCPLMVVKAMISIKFTVITIYSQYIVT